MSELEEIRHYVESGAEPREALEWAGETRAKMVDLKFCDLLGTWQHVSLPLTAEGIAGIEGLLGAPLAEATITKRAAREALRVITSSYEYHGGFRLRTLA